MPTLVFISDAAQTTHKHHADGRAYIKAFLVYFHRSTPKYTRSTPSLSHCHTDDCLDLQPKKVYFGRFFEKTHFQLAVMLRVFRAQ